MTNDKEQAGGGTIGSPVAGASLGGKGASESPATVETGGGAPALTARIAELEERLAEAQRELEAGLLERQIDAALVGAGAIDAEVGRVMVLHTMEEDASLGVEEAVSALRSGKGFLFASGAGGYSGGAAYAPGATSSGVEEEVASIRDSAAGSGDRGELLRYMRARRSS